MSAAWTSALGAVLVLFVAAMFGISFWAQRKVHDVEDFIVAGRRLPFALALPGLFATWFGAGTLLAATDEVREEGLRAIALEPLGSGLCLIVAGIWFAGPLWKRKLLTLIDFYRDRFGPRAEWLSGALMIPGYFGWIAAQFIALGGILENLFALPTGVGVLTVAVVGALYTLIGGMWSVTLTDAIQIGILVLGLLVLGVTVCVELGSGDLFSGAVKLWSDIPGDKRVVVPLESGSEFVSWCTVLAIAALGNIPAQDLSQRISASKSATVAKRACITAGVAYIAVGLIPVLLGLGTARYLPGDTTSALPAIASLYLHPAAAILFILAIVSAVLSTIDSAILSPSTVLAQNIVPQWPAFAARLPTGIALNRWAVAVVTLASLALAFSGARAYALLEAAYAIGLVAHLVPLAGGLLSERGGERAAVASMTVATGVWGAHLAVGAEEFLGLTPLLPATLACTVIGLICYVAVAMGASDQARKVA